MRMLRMLHDMLDALAHRGPDDRGVSVRGGIGLAAARLSLVDWSGGGQPMEDGGLAVVLNGEIYNYVELRRELEQHGVRFRGRSDTEVVLRGFAHWGPELLDRLEGMYALAIRDGAILHLARDPFGMKPLHVWCPGGLPEGPSGELSAGSPVVFASELKALLRCPWVPRGLDATGLAERLVFGHTLGSRTLLADVRQVAPGALVTIAHRDERVAVETSRWSQPRPRPRPASVDEAVDLLAELLRASVARRVQADHPVATYLSGGLDSTIVAALRPDRSGAPSFVVTDGNDAADVRHARSVASALALDHAEIVVTREPPVAWMADAVLAMEAPVVPSLALVSAPHVRRVAKAAVCGEGSDELFAGYSVHDDPEPYLRELQQRLVRLRAAELGAGALATTIARLEELGTRDPDERSRAVHAFLLHETMPSKHLAIWDRGSMAASLEVRMPFLDREIRDLALSLPREWSSPRKALVLAVARRVLPPALADALVGRAKSAAPDALRETLHRLRGLVAAAMPGAWLRRHPLQRLTSSPQLLVALDLFLLAFVAGDGRLPEGLAIETMYARHELELRAAHRAACDALFGADGPGA